MIQLPFNGTFVIMKRILKPRNTVNISEQPAPRDNASQTVFISVSSTHLYRKRWPKALNNPSVIPFNSYFNVFFIVKRRTVKENVLATYQSLFRNCFTLMTLRCESWFHLYNTLNFSFKNSISLFITLNNIQNVLNCGNFQGGKTVWHLTIVT